MDPTSSTQTAIPTPTFTAPAPTTMATPSDPQTIKAPPGDGKENENINPIKPYYEFEVGMSCGSCSGAVERVLKKNIIERECWGMMMMIEGFSFLVFFLGNQLLNENFFPHLFPLSLTYPSFHPTSPTRPHNLQPANSFSVSLKDQSAIIWGPTIPPLDEVKGMIAKTGKKVGGNIRQKRVILSFGSLYRWHWSFGVDLIRF